MTGEGGQSGVRRSHADMIVRKVLRIKERPANVSENAALKAFEKSMLISATRCTLTYVVFPFVLPMVHVLKGVAPVLGIVIGVLAMCCDVFTIRRFFAIDHKWRWYFAAVASSVICLLAVLLVQDIVHVINGTTA
jgi:ABC-type iron transport system FetAB permease component